jgi:hypothetical protein
MPPRKRARCWYACAISEADRNGVEVISTAARRDRSMSLLSCEASFGGEASSPHKLIGALATILRAVVRMLHRVRTQSACSDRADVEALIANKVLVASATMQRSAVPAKAEAAVARRAYFEAFTARDAIRFPSV